MIKKYRNLQNKLSKASEIIIFLEQCKLNWKLNVYNQESTVFIIKFFFCLLCSNFIGPKFMKIFKILYDSCKTEVLNSLNILINRYYAKQY